MSDSISDEAIYCLKIILKNKKNGNRNDFSIENIKINILCDIKRFEKKIYENNNYKNECLDK